jgi:hypothetical protein
VCEGNQGFIAPLNERAGAVYTMVEGDEPEGQILVVAMLGLKLAPKLQVSVTCAGELPPEILDVLDLPSLRSQLPEKKL